MRPSLADAQDVFRRRIEIDDKQVVIEQDDARTQTFENVLCVVPRDAAIIGRVAA